MAAKAFATLIAGAVGSALYRSPTADAAAGGAFSQSEFKPYKLESVSDETHNSKRFRFALPDKSTALGYPIASCISVRYVDKDGKDVVRPYTPINSPSETGHFDIVVKKYKNSKMGSHLFSLKKGDTIDAKGPWGTFSVAPSQYAKIGMIAGGTGLTPMYQILHHVLGDPKNTTQIALLYSNHTEKDILLRKELDAIAAQHASTFSVTHTLTAKAPGKWAGKTGRINKEMIQAVPIPAPSEANIAVLVSGPPDFMKALCGPKDYAAYPPKQGELTGALKELGYTSAQVYKF